jgi:hypothetical protein
MGRPKLTEQVEYFPESFRTGTKYSTGARPALRENEPLSRLSAMERVMPKRLRFGHSKTLEERLAEEAARFRKAAEEAPTGTPRDLDA